MQKEKPLIDKKEIKLGIIGQTPGNGHPYSWSAIFNGYDEKKMTEECPYAGIPMYLNKEPKDTLQIPDAKITHICCQGNGDFTPEHVSECSLIENVVEKPEDMIGKVDAVIIATDIGSEHVKRALPFVESNIPLFIDKPMVDNLEDLNIFNNWIEKENKPILSSSSMRYAKEFLPYHISTNELGKLRFVSVGSCKWWETYGIHALEGVYPIIGPGFETVQNIGTKEKNIVHFTHKNGLDLVVSNSYDMAGGFGYLTLCGTKGSVQLNSRDSFYSFKRQLVEFIKFLRTGIRPFPYSETKELMKMIIGGKISRERGGEKIKLDDLI